MLIRLDTASLITSGKLRADCGDLRFRDAYGSLEYWLEEGCNTASTRVWVKVPVVPVGDSVIEVRYGTPLSASASNGRSTFAFFDDFSDGVIDTQHWLVIGAPWYTITESGGAIRLAGTTNAINQFDRAYFYFVSSAVWLPASFAVDSELSIAASPASFKASVGTGELNLYGNDLPKRIGYWNGSSWVQIGQSTVGSVTFTGRKFGVGYTGPVDSRTFGPLGDPARHVVLTSGRDCIPCNRLDYRADELGEHCCVRDISTAQVAEAARRLLELENGGRV